MRLLSITSPVGGVLVRLPMSNTLKRVILFIIAIPCLSVFLLFVTHLHFLGLCAVLTLIGIKSGMEMRFMMKGLSLPVWTAVLPGLSPLLAWSISAGFLPPESAVIALTLGCMWAFGGVIFITEEELSLGIQRIGSRLIMLLYPGFFLWWIQRMSDLAQARYALLVFMLIIFLNDSAAWLFGLLFGRHRNLFAVSPNKSLEGFIAGIAATLIVILTACFLLPDFLVLPTWQLVLFGILLGVTTGMGDLVESAIKRATSTKDSGRMMLGRGGMLDSVDSLLFTAPVYYMLFKIGG